MEIVKNNYRQIDALSASDIKLFNKNRSDFFNQVVLKKRKQKSSDSIILGELVDFYLSDCNGDLELFERTLDEKFIIVSEKKLTGQLFELTQELINLTIADMTEDGNTTSLFSERFVLAFEKMQKLGKFSGKTIDYAIGKFENSPEEEYFKEKIENINKVPIDEELLKKAKFICEKAKNYENTSFLFEYSEKFENFGKQVIEWEYKNKKCKSELDKLIFDHKEKKIRIVEIKTNWDSENFEYTYLRLRYDLSACFYILAIKDYILKEYKEYKDYSIDFSFLVIDTSPNGLLPTIRTFSEIDFEKSLNGFTTKGLFYRGLNDLIDEIIWCEETNNWDLSKEAFDKKAVLPININYQN